MRLRFAFIGAVLATVSSSAAGAAETQPYLAMRSVQLLQDRMTLGDATAAAANAKALAANARQFAAAKPAVWADPRNARALVIYLFSGGNASVIAEAVRRDSIAKDQQVLFDGALAYALGHDDDARTNLLPFDARSVPTALGGHLALIQATLVAGSDKARAVELLDLARLLEPGTLVEEAALRKEMLLVGAGAAQLDKFTLLARRYQSAFRKSLYVDNYRHLLADAAREAAGSDDLPSALRLTRIVASLEPNERRRLYLALAREALVAGRLTMASFAAEEAAHLSRKGEKEEARATLYFGASAIVGARFDHGLRALQGVDETKLDPSDRELRQSALQLADMIRTPTFAAAPQPAPTEAVALVAGERALGDAEAALKIANP